MRNIDAFNLENQALKHSLAYAQNSAYIEIIEYIKELNITYTNVRKVFAENLLL
jgi:hypothetical protein